MEHPSSRWTRLVVLFLLLLAATQTVVSYFHSSYSYLDLQSYAKGTERNPFQRRMGMMPILRAAETSPTLQRAAEKLRHKAGGKAGTAFREMTPEALASIVVGLISVQALVLFLYWYGTLRFVQLWWLPAAAFLVMLDVTLVTRYQINVWYPYDLPHFMLFGIASVCVMEGWWVAGTCFFLLDIPVRETTIFLLPVIAAVAWSRTAKKMAIFLPAALLCCWIPVQLYAHYRFLHNSSEAAFRLPGNLLLLKNPLNWPQIASAFGFLLVPLILGRRLLSRGHRAFLLGALPGVIVTCLLGVWTETRIFDEWLPAAACLITYEILGSLGLSSVRRVWKE